MVDRISRSGKVSSQYRIFVMWTMETPVMKDGGGCAK